MSYFYQWVQLVNEVSQFSKAISNVMKMPAVDTAVPFIGAFPSLLFFSEASS